LPTARTLLNRQALLVAGMVAQKASAAAIVVILCRYLLPDQFGAYVVAMSLIELAFLGIGFGTQTIMIRAVAQGRDLAATYRAGMAVRFVSALVAVPALLLTARAMPGAEVGLLAFLMLPGMLAYVFAETPLALLLGRNRMAWKAGLDFLASLAGLGLMWGFLAAGYGLPGAATAFSLRRILNLLLAEWACARLDGVSLMRLWGVPGRLAPAAAEARRLWREAAPLGLAGLAVALHTRWAPLLLAAWISREAAGWFAGAWQFFEVVTLVGTVMAGAAFPALAAAHAQGRAAGERLTVAAGRLNVLAGILLAAAMSLAAGWILPLVLGRAYAPAVAALRLLLAAVPLIFLYEVLLHSLYANNRQVRVVVLRLVGLGTSLLFNSLLLPRWGLLGGASWPRVSWPCGLLPGSCPWQARPLQAAPGSWPWPTAGPGSSSPGRLLPLPDWPWRWPVRHAPRPKNRPYRSGHRAGANTSRNPLVCEGS
jgi:O-antigen/teichoic acid export membrane protein